MTKEDRDELDRHIAKTVLRAHVAYIAACNMADCAGLNVRDVNFIYRINGRGKVHQITEYGEPNET